MTTLETERLVLRPLVPNDIPALHRFHNDPEVRRYLWDNTEVSAETVAAIVDASEACFADLGAGFFAIEMTTNPGEIAGFCGFRRFEGGDRLLLARDAEAALLDDAEQLDHGRLDAPQDRLRIDADPDDRNDQRHHHQLLAQAQAKAGGAPGSDLDLHLGHVDRHRAFALAGLAADAELHGLGDLVRGQRLWPQSAAQRQTQGVGPAPG